MGTRVQSARIRSPDAEASKRVIQAMLEMKKIEIAGLERAAAGG